MLNYNTFAKWITDNNVTKVECNGLTHARLLDDLMYQLVIDADPFTIGRNTILKDICQKERKLPVKGTTIAFTFNDNMPYEVYINAE